MRSFPVILSASLLGMSVVGFVAGRAFSARLAAPAAVERSGSARANEEVAARRESGGEVESDPVLGETVHVRRVVDELQKLTAADFEDLEKVRRRFGAVKKTGRHDGWYETTTILNEGFVKKYQEALARRWFELSPQTALAAVVKLTPTARAWSYPPPVDKDMLLAMARVRPEEVINTLPRPGLGAGYQPDGISDIAVEAFQALGAMDIGKGRKLLENCGSEMERKAMEAALLRGPESKDPLSAARDFGVSALLDVIRSWPTDQSLQITEFVVDFPDAPWETLSPNLNLNSLDDDAAIGMIRWLDAEQRKHLLERSASFPGKLQETIRRRSLEAWFADDPGEAWKWTIAHGSAEDDTSRGIIQFRDWLQREPQPARAWAEAQDAPVAELLQKVLAPPAPAWDGSPEQLAAFAAAKHDQDLGDYVKAVAAQDPAAAADALAQLPEAIDASRAMKTVLEKWWDQDAAATREWAEALAPGKRRDQALEALIDKTYYSNDPWAAGEMVLEVQDAKRQRELAENVYGQMRRRNATTARDWLENLPGADPRWKKWFLRAR